MAIKMDINPCIWDLDWLSNNSGAPGGSNNITFPRPGTWNSATREFTFSGGNSDVYPLDKVKIMEPLEIISQPSYFSCSSDGGWLEKSMSDPAASEDQNGELNLKNNIGRLKPGR